MPTGSAMQETVQKVLTPGKGCANNLYMTTTRNPIYEAAVKNVARRWGTDAKERVGVQVYRALVAEQVMAMSANQDVSVSAENVRKIIDECWQHIAGIV